MAYWLADGNAIVCGHDALLPGKKEQSRLEPKNPRWSSGALTRTPLTFTAPVPEPVGKTTIEKLCPVVKPLEAACTLIVQVPSPGLDQLVVAASGAENVESGQSLLQR